VYVLLVSVWHFYLINYLKYFCLFCYYTWFKSKVNELNLPHIALT